MGLDGDGQRPARSIAAHQLHVVFARQIEHTVAKLLQPGGINAGQCQIQQKPSRFRTHGREIAEIDGQRLVAE